MTFGIDSSPSMRLLSPAIHTQCLVPVSLSLPKSSLPAAAAAAISLATALELSPGRRIKHTLPRSTELSADMRDSNKLYRESWFPPLLHEQLVLVCGQTWGKASGLQPAHSYK